MIDDLGGEPGLTGWRGCSASGWKYRYRLN